MISLDDELKEVEKVRMDLVATKENPNGHWETYQKPHHTMSDGGKIPSYHRDGYDPDDVVTTYTTERKFIVPKDEQEQVIDKEKRQAAKEKLKQIYESTVWYSVKYQAGLGLRKDDMPLDAWISELNADLYQGKKETNQNQDSRLDTLVDACKLYEFSKSVHLKRVIRRVSEQNETQVKQTAHEFLLDYFKKYGPRTNNRRDAWDIGVLCSWVGALAPVAAYGVAAIYNPEIRKYFTDADEFLINVGVKSLIGATIGMCSGIGFGALKDKIITKRQFKKWVEA